MSLQESAAGGEAVVHSYCGSVPAVAFPQDPDWHTLQVPAHSLSGSVLFVILAQAPSLPPVLEAKQDWQVPPQAPLQHTLSIQFPEQHSPAPEQAVPLSLHVDNFTWP